MKVDIIGGGPSGACLGALLAKAGINVTIYDPCIRPELIVGESLIPAVIPILRRLGVEENVAKIGVYKPGATLILSKDVEWTIPFASGGAVQYSYNVARKEFDAILLESALNAGCKHIRTKMSPEVINDRLMTDADLVVDASGRSRVLTKLLSLRETAGPRRDIALFAHFEKAYMPYGGNIHIDVFEDAWAWRIPLQGKISVGIVSTEININDFDNIINKRFGKAVEKRISNVFKYNNYQLVSNRLFGENWALVGDAAGFADPVFSSGMYLALSGAESLAETIIQEKDFFLYEANYLNHIRNWQMLIDTFYDKSFFSLVLAANKLTKLKSRDWFDPIARVISGFGINDPEDLRMLSFSISNSARCA